MAFELAFRQRRLAKQKAKLMHNQWSGIETRRSRAINATIVTPLLWMSIARPTTWFPRGDQTRLSLLINMSVRSRLKKLVLSRAAFSYD